MRVSESVLPGIRSRFSPRLPDVYTRLWLNQRGSLLSPSMVAGAKAGAGNPVPP